MKTKKRDSIRGKLTEIYLAFHRIQVWYLAFSFHVTEGQHSQCGDGPDPETNCPLLVHLMTKAPCQACIITTDSHINSCTNGLEAETATLACMYAFYI